MIRFSLKDTKEGLSVRPVGLPALELLEQRRPDEASSPTFPGTIEGKPVGFPKHWRKIAELTPLADVAPHVLRHSYARLANDLGFTGATVAALLGHAQGSVTTRYIHEMDTAIIKHWTRSRDTCRAYSMA